MLPRVFGDEIEELSIIDVLTGKTKKIVESLSIYPNSHSPKLWSAYTKKEEVELLKRASDRHFKN